MLLAAEGGHSVWPSDFGSDRWTNCADAEQPPIQSHASHLTPENTPIVDLPLVLGDVYPIVLTPQIMSNGLFSPVFSACGPVPSGDQNSAASGTLAVRKPRSLPNVASGGQETRPASKYFWKGDFGFRW